MNAGDRLAKVLFYYGFIEDDKISEGKIICPFHEDINPSLIYNLEEGSWYCFGCGESGTAVEFVEKMLVYQERNTMYTMRELYNILRSKRARTIKMAKRTARKHDYDDELIRADNFYNGLLKTQWGTNSSDESLFIIDYMAQRGFMPEHLKKYGGKYTYSEFYPLVFPITDNGEFRGYVCRAINQPELEKKRKYLYNYGFRRELTLCGDYEVGSTVFIVEGFMDMLKLKTFGIKNVVAILGWKITQTQVEKLRQAKINNVICCLDNDHAGDKGYIELCKHFRVLKFQYEDGINDPGEMSKNDFQRQLKKSMEVKQINERKEFNNGKYARNNEETS